jgi:hypothetical protein
MLGAKVMPGAMVLGARAGLGPNRRRSCALALALLLAASCSSTSVIDDTAPATGGTSSSGTSGGTPSSGGTSPSGTSGDATSTGGTSGVSSPSDAGAAGATSTPAGPPYADVTAVSVTGTSGSYTFDVTIESADIDCSQYADWWEVLTADGALVYRRILDHSHTDANGTSDPDAPGNTFTRSGGPVSVTENDVVVVRAHMSVGGYNGAVMRGSASDGFAQAPDIGSDFAANVESEDPQPTGCEF